MGYFCEMKEKGDKQRKEEDQSHGEGWPKNGAVYK